MAALAPYLVSSPCGSRSRNRINSGPRRRVPSRRPAPSAPLLPFLKAPVRFAHAWNRSSNPGDRPPIGRPCIAAPWIARPNSRPKSRGFTPCFASVSSNSSAERPRPLPRPNGRFRSPPLPTHHRVGPEASSRAGRAQSGVTIPISRPFPKTTNSPRSVPLFALRPALRGLPEHRGFDHPGGRRPSASPDHPPSPLSADLLVCRPCRHRHCPAATPADPQEHPGGLDRGVPARGQGFVLPSDRSTLGRLGHARPGPVVGHGHRRPEAPGPALRAGVRGAGASEPDAAVVARRRDPLAFVRRHRGEGWVSVVSVGLPLRRGGGLRAGGRAGRTTFRKST